MVIRSRKLLQQNITLSLLIDVQKIKEHTTGRIQCTIQERKPQRRLIWLRW